MANYIFNDEEDLGKVVSEMHPFCMLSPKRPIADVKQITTDICGAKYSKLCGFVFTSKQQSDHMTFLVVYCPKLRSNFVRNDKGLSGWYFWKHIGPQNEMIMDKEMIKLVYGFDVEKFFQSDVFETVVPKLRKQVSAALSTVVQQYLDGMSQTAHVAQSQSKRNAEFYVSCVATAVAKMADASRTGSLAYNGNMTYQLVDKKPGADSIAEADISGDEAKLRTVGDLESLLSMLYDQSGASASDRLVLLDTVTGRELEVVNVRHRPGIAEVSLGKLA